MDILVGNDEKEPEQHIHEHCARAVRMTPISAACVATPSYAQRARNSDQAYECSEHRVGALIRTECQDCPPGFQRSLGESTCTKCGVGQRQPAVATACEACTAGKSNANNGSVLCFDCSMGSFAANEGASTCDAYGRKVSNP